MRCIGYGRSLSAGRATSWSHALAGSMLHISVPIPITAVRSSAFADERTFRPHTDACNSRLSSGGFKPPRMASTDFTLASSSKHSKGVPRNPDVVDGGAPRRAPSSEFYTPVLSCCCCCNLRALRIELALGAGLCGTQPVVGPLRALS